jgi:hypothetical protein
MKCPVCSHHFPLGWGRYLSSPLKKHDCPKCQAPIQVDFSTRDTLLLVFLLCVFAGIPSFLIPYCADDFVTGMEWGIACFFILVGLVIIPFDRWMDDHHRKLVTQ